MKGRLHRSVKQLHYAPYDETGCWVMKVDDVRNMSLHSATAAEVTSTNNSGQVRKAPMTSLNER